MSGTDYTSIAICIGFGLVLFGLTSHKSILVYPFIVVAVYFAGRKYNPGIWVGYMVSRRAFLVPALLNHNYFEFFFNNPWYWWSGSRLTLGMVPVPYPQTAPFTVGIEYFGDSDTSANIGWYGSGYSQAGLFGALIYSVLLGLLFAYFNACAKRIGNILPVIIVHVLTALSSTDTLTLFLTDGLIVLLLLLRTLAATNAEKARKPRVRQQQGVPLQA